MYRLIKDQIKNNLNSDQVIILLGPRQVGKTTILKDLFKKNYIYIDLDDKIYRDFFDSLSLVKYQSFIDSNLNSIKNKNQSKLVLILDEAQRLKDPGLCAKLFFDQIKSVKIILTGSSSLDIKRKTSESLAGRKISLFLYPLSLQEYLIQKNIPFNSSLISKLNLKIEDNNLDEIVLSKITTEILERMRIGLYPGTLNQEPESYLHELIDSVILKDIFYLNLVKNTDGLINLLRLLAYQIGTPLNISDISKRIGIARKTVYDYIKILEKSNIIFTLEPYNTNNIDEISKYNNIYFFDLGIRNAIINDFRPVNLRNDFEKIFKNFIISEIFKLNKYYEKRFKLGYWKTTQGSEVDLILEKDNKINSIKIHPYKNKFSKGFKNRYKDSSNFIVNLENYYKFII